MPPLFRRARPDAPSRFGPNRGDWRKSLWDVVSFPLVFAAMALVMALGIVVLALLTVAVVLFLPLAVWSAAGYRGGTGVPLAAGVYYLALTAVACFCPGGVVWGPLVFGAAFAGVAWLTLLPNPSDYFSRPQHRRAAFAALRYAAAAGHHPHLESVRVVGSFADGLVVRLRCGERVPVPRDYAVASDGRCAGEVDRKKARHLVVTPALDAPRPE
jgi:hypothetical protein